MQIHSKCTGTRVSPPNRYLLASLVAPLLIGTAIPAAAIDAERERELIALVRQDCGSCHGMTLKGGLGKPLQPADLAESDVESIASIILEGVPGRPMPPWKGLLNKADAEWIARKLKEGFPQ